MEEVLNTPIDIEQGRAEAAPRKDRTIIGVQILRFYMAFMVASSHLGGTPLVKWLGIFYIFQPFHVPVFMLLSFLLCGRYFLSPTKELVRKRLLRILIPFVTWGILSYFLCLILWPISFSTLVNQLFTGYPLNNALWYLATSLWICILFWIIRIIADKKAFLIVITILSVACIVSQYTGLNYSLFNDLPYNIKFTIGRCFEMIPYATIGIFLSMAVPYLDALDRKYHLLLFFGAGILMATIVAIRTFFISYRPQGFDYPGAYLIVVAILLVLTAYTNPINFVQNEKFKSIVDRITSYTLGVFCMHIVIGRFVEWAFISLQWETYTTVMVLVTYAICYALSFLISLIPNKYIKQAVN